MLVSRVRDGRQRYYRCRCGQLEWNRALEGGEGAGVAVAPEDCSPLSAGELCEHCTVQRAGRTPDRGARKREVLRAQWPASYLYLQPSDGCLADM